MKHFVNMNNNKQTCKQIVDQKSAELFPILIPVANQNPQFSK